MGERTRQSVPAVADLDGQDRTEALVALSLAQRWKTTPERWGKVATLIDIMSKALADGDGDSFRSASADLLLAAPRRATGFGESSTVPAPEPIRQRVDKLIDMLAR